jgi:hypothetical protein
MQNKWSDVFIEQLKLNGIACLIKNRVKGWIETIIIENKTCYVKSATYDNIKSQYFQGVDTNKLHDSGNFVIFCGGNVDKIQDIFIIPWDVFFKDIKSGKPVNTYKPPREYWQYKFYIRYRNGKWLMFVQPMSRTLSLDVTAWRYDMRKAIEYFR